MHQDPVSDLLTRVRNASMARHSRVAVPSSKLKLEILKLLKQEGFISDYSVSDKYHGVIKIYLKYNSDGKPTITKIKKISKPSIRVYSKAKEVPNALNGYGVTIISTSKGIMTDRDAKKNNVGGEVLCQVW
jgi:small subunit ribosomal protein S8